MIDVDRLRLKLFVALHNTTLHSSCSPPPTLAGSKGGLEGNKKPHVLNGLEDQLPLPLMVYTSKE